MITAHVEKWSDHIAEWEPLTHLHYRELALNQDKVPLSPQYAIYQDRERVGELLFVTLRDAGRMVGYYIGFVSPALNYSTCLTCLTSVFYVLPGSRNGNAGTRLFRFVETELRRRGVQRWFMGSKIHTDASALFKRIGAEPVETYYSKWLGEE